MVRFSSDYVNCPVCRKELSSRDEVDVSVIPHLITCNAIRYPGAHGWMCQCGSLAGTVAQLFVHFERVQHDWPKLLTTQALEEM